MAATAHTSTGRKPDAGPSLQDHRWRDLGLHAYVKIAILGGLFCLLFHGELRGLVHLWLTDPSWSHGFLIPLFSLYFIHLHHREILGLEHVRDPLADLLHGHRSARMSINQTRPSYLGLVLLLGVLAVYAFNVVSPSGYAYLRPVSTIAALGAIVLFLGGRRLLRHTWLPIVFLLFAVPLPRRYYVGVTLPLQQAAASAAAALLSLLNGVEATAGGTIIEIVRQGQRLEPGLDVEEACSGMRLLMAFVALGVAMAYIHPRPMWQRVVLLLSTIPIAVLCNIIRVTATGLLYVLADPKYTQGAYHDMLGLAMLPLAFIFYGALAAFMSNLFVDEDSDRNVIVRRRVVK